jgi:hypothetical protein
MEVTPPARKYGTGIDVIDRSQQREYIDTSRFCTGRPEKLIKEELKQVNVRRLT